MEVTSRNRTLIRCLKLVRQVPYGWMTTSRLVRLAEEHGVSTRTIRRDLAALEAAGYRVAAYPHRSERDYDAAT